jgi:hypothetical protein
MHLHLHQLLDAIVTDKIRIHTPGFGWRQPLPAEREALRQDADDLVRAEKFAIDYTGAFDVRIQETAWDFYQHRVLDLPARSVYLEYPIWGLKPGTYSKPGGEDVTFTGSAQTRVAFLLCHEMFEEFPEPIIVVRQFSWASSADEVNGRLTTAGWFADEVAVALLRDDPLPTLPLRRWDIDGTPEWDYDRALPWVEKARDIYSAAVMFALGLLAARGPLVERVEAPERLNRARQRARKVPLFSYHRVHIPAAARDVSGMCHGVVVERRSPRLHFRRGHVRHLRHPRYGDARPTFVRPTVVGSAELGFVDKDYVVRRVIP